jgi:hypothetical protein
MKVLNHQEHEGHEEEFNSFAISSLLLCMTLYRALWL